MVSNSTVSGEILKCGECGIKYSPENHKVCPGCFVTSWYIENPIVEDVTLKHIPKEGSGSSLLSERRTVLNDGSIISQSLFSGTGTVVINGNVVMRNGQLVGGGKSDAELNIGKNQLVFKNPGNIEMTIYGPCKSVSGSNSQIRVLGNVNGDVTSSNAQIKVEGSVTGNAETSNGKIITGNIGGYARTSNANITAEKISGGAKTTNGNINKAFK